jgi:hypothetical protein
MKHPTRALAAAAVCACAALPITASAQASDTWQFSASLYLYLPAIGGTTTFPQSGGGSSVGIDGNNVLDSLRTLFMGSFEARKGVWGGFTDVLYVDLGQSKSGSREIRIGGNQIPIGASANLDYDLKGTVWTLAGTYRAVSDVRQPLDVFAGARMLDIKQTLSWQFGGNVGSIPLANRAGTRETTSQNWDAIVGAKGRVGLGAERKWFVPYYLDVGTGESKFTWQAMTGIGYSFGWGDVVGSWRYLDYQMKSGSVMESLNFNGPAVSAVFHW